MLSDEEKKEYEELKSLLYTGTISQYGKRKLIDLIEKQQKEIEELKEKNENLNWYFENQKDNFVHKDKIKAKIEEYKESGSVDGTNDILITEMQSLLNEEE